MKNVTDIFAGLISEDTRLKDFVLLIAEIIRDEHRVTQFREGQLRFKIIDTFEEMSPDAELMPAAIEVAVWIEKRCFTNSSGKRLSTILKKFRRTMKSKSFGMFVDLIFEYSRKNYRLSKDQEQLLVFWIRSFKHTRDMTIKQAVNIARWVNTDAGGFTGISGDIFEKTPAT